MLCLASNPLFLRFLYRFARQITSELSWPCNLIPAKMSIHSGSWVGYATLPMATLCGATGQLRHVRFHHKNHICRHGFRESLWIAGGGRFQETWSLRNGNLMLGVCCENEARSDDFFKGYLVSTEGISAPVMYKGILEFKIR